MVRQRTFRAIYTRTLHPLLFSQRRNRKATCPTRCNATVTHHMLDDHRADVEVRRISVDAAWQNISNRPKRPPPAPPAATPPPPPNASPLGVFSFYQQQRPLLPASLQPAEKEKLLGQRPAPSGGPWDSSGARAAAYSTTRSAVPEFIQRSAKAAEAAYRAYYSATGGCLLPMPLSRKVPFTAGPPALISEPVQPGTPDTPLLATIVAPPIKRPAPPAPSAPKTPGLYTDSDLRAALLALRQPCVPQQEARVTLAAKKRPRDERPLDPLEDERAVWNRITGNELMTGQVALIVELALAPTLTLTVTPPPPTTQIVSRRVISGGPREDDARGDFGGPRFVGATSNPNQTPDHMHSS